MLRLSKVVSSSICKVFGMTRPGIEPRSPGTLANGPTENKEHISLYGCTKLTLTKCTEKMLLYAEQIREATFHKTTAVRPLTPISKTIEIWWTRYTGHCWRSKYEIISDVVQWPPSHGRTSVGQSTRTNRKQVCVDTGCSLENLPGAMDDKDVLNERESGKFMLIAQFDNIIIIMSCRQHGYPWPSLATSPNHSSPPAGLLSYILCPHIAAVCTFGLVVLLLLGHMWGSIGVPHLRNLIIYIYIYEGVIIYIWGSDYTS